MPYVLGEYRNTLFFVIPKIASRWVKWRRVEANADGCVKVCWQNGESDRCLRGDLACTELAGAVRNDAMTASG